MCGGWGGGGNLKNNSKAKGRKNGRKRGAQRENERKRKRKLKGTQGKRGLRPLQGVQRKAGPFQDDGSPSVALGRGLTRVSGESQAHLRRAGDCPAPLRWGPPLPGQRGGGRVAGSWGQVPRAPPLCARTDAWGSCLRRACCFSAALQRPPAPLPALLHLGNIHS